jgi:hypothetical protein
VLHNTSAGSGNYRYIAYVSYSSCGLNLTLVFDLFCYIHFCFYSDIDCYCVGLTNPPPPLNGPAFSLYGDSPLVCLNCRFYNYTFSNTGMKN